MLKWLFVLGVGLGVSLFAMYSDAADLTVDVNGVRNSKGKIRFAIFDKAREFPEGHETISINVPAKSGVVTVRFSSINPGIYAVAVHHDEDNDNEMDTNFLGIPEEGYGFSNNPKILLSPPTFEISGFKVGDKNKSISMDLNY